MNLKNSEAYVNLVWYGIVVVYVVLLVSYSPMLLRENTWVMISMITITAFVNVPVAILVFLVLFAINAYKTNQFRQESFAQKKIKQQNVTGDYGSGLFY